MKNNYKYSKHIQERIKQRNIKKEWIDDTIKNPDKYEKTSNIEEQFFKRIIKFSGRCLKVIVNPLTKIIVTAFFDRKMTKKDCK